MRWLTRTTLALGLLVVAAAAPAARAQAPLDAQDFVARASVSSMFGVESATLALHKSNSPQIKEFAHRLANDLGTTGSSLRQIAARRSDVSLPERPDARHLDLLRDLGQKQGEDFDRAYIAAQRQFQEETSALLAEYAEKGADEDLKSFAAKALPTVQELARRAQELEKPR